jgi:hypothetical protein
MTKKTNLLSRLRNISIEGPEDFAAYQDLYISKEKQIPSIQSQTTYHDTNQQLNKPGSNT